MCQTLTPKLTATSTNADSDTSCPNPGVWPYVFAVLYFLHLKLILLTVLFALFSTTAASVVPESDAIWKFQRYELVMDFAMRRCLPPPLNAVTYLWVAIVELLRLCARTVQRRKQEKSPFIDMPKGQRLSEGDYLYWKQKVLEYSNSLDSANEDTVKTQGEKLTLMFEDVDYQRTVLNQLRGQVQEVQRRMHLSLVYLESLKQVSSRTDPTSLTTPQQQTMLHNISRQSPYPGTKIRRCPVPNKFVPWEVMWLDYYPVAYTRPRSQFPGPLQAYVDDDILMLKTSDNVQSVPSLTWNCMSVSSAGVSIDRRSWIEDADGANIIYMLDSEGVPRNPAGRTGLKGKGALPRWGPNHYVLFIISRYQKSRISLTQARGLEIALMRIFRTDQYVLPGDFVPGEQKYDAVMRICFKMPESKPVTTAEQVTTFFTECAVERPGATDPNQTVECSVARRGYMDDPMNTDNCWREVELWKVHYNGDEILGEKFQANVIWRLVTDDLFLKLPSSHSNLFNEVWNFQGMLPA